MRSTHEPTREFLGQDPTLRVLELINGADIERSLLDLARIGGTPLEGISEQPERYAVNRLALSPIDLEARTTFIQPLMEAAGMTVQEHPFGLIGTLRGEEPDLPPVVIFSHTDSVPRADMYDGVTGVMGGIKVVEAIKEAGVTAKRNIHVVALTGEESSAFGFALFGSRGMWHGLTDRELAACIPGGRSIQETLGQAASEIVRNPVVGESGLIPTPHAVVELHVEQNDTLDRAGVDLGVVEAIAAPVRFNVRFGEQPLEIDPTEPSNATYFKLTVRGHSDHSGATPMGLENRADGLVETAKLLLALLDQEANGSAIDIGGIEVEEQALNKIPGTTITTLRVSGSTESDVLARLKQVKVAMDTRNYLLRQTSAKFDEEPVVIEEIDRGDAGSFFKRHEVSPRQKAVLSFMTDVNEVANAHTAEKVVGTVGTVTMTESGDITLGLDVRGIDKDSRDKTIAEIQARAAALDPVSMAKFGESLPGSGDPVALDPELVQITQSLIDTYQIGTSVVMFSAAGHDAQNAAKAGHPTVMIFCQSNAGGIAHHPDAYTRPENLEQGVRALAALTLRLSLN